MGSLRRALKAGVFDDFWAMPPTSWMGRAGTGEVVTTSAALRVSVVFRCITLLAGTLAKLPLQLYRDRPDGMGRDRASDRPEYPVLHSRANAQMTSFSWRQTAMVHVLTWGNTYSEIVRDGFGRLVELVPLRPDLMEVRWEDDARVYYYRQGGRQPIRLTQDRVFHVPGVGFDGLIGYAPLTLMRETLGSYGAARDYGQATFRNGAKPALVVTHPQKLDDLAVDRLAAQMDRMRGAGNAGRTVILEQGTDFKEVGFSNQDSQFIQTKDHELAEFARWYGVPPHMVGLTDRSTSWGTGIEAQTRGFFDYTMDDWFVNWEQNLKAQLLWDTDVIAEFNRNAMLRGDTLQRLQAYKLGRDMGMWSPNDLLAKENENPRTDPGGDEFLRPLNYLAEGGDDDGRTPVVRTIAVGPRATQPAANGHAPEVTIP